MPNRGKRIALLAHCILNQNAKVGGLACEPGMIMPVLDVLHTHNVGVIQLPCPEMAVAGVRRWWQTKRGYNIPSFRRHCREQVVPIVDQLVDYHQNGYQVVALVGAEGSPSCGISVCGTDADLGGPPHIPQEAPEVHEKGILMEELLDEISVRGLPAPPAIGLQIESDVPLTEIASALEAFFESNDQH